MLALLVRNSRIIQSTGMSFAVLGTTMHMLNVANLMSPSLSHTWSAIAILGFVLTASSQIRGSLSQAMPKIKRAGKAAPRERNDVALP
jgi:ABC-type enterochelin transport system permease subunit